MIIPVTDIEPMLVDVFSDESVLGDSSDSGVDDMWWEVGELLETIIPLDLDDKNGAQQVICENSCSAEKPIVATPTPSQMEKKRAKPLNTCVDSSNKRRKSMDENDQKREIRMARNRASAERTRLRRLEHIKSLENQVTEINDLNERTLKMLQEQFGKTCKEIEASIGPCTVMLPDFDAPKRPRVKKDDAREILRKLESEAECLPQDEVAKLRKQARMARNRASAERTRLRRLEAAHQLEVQVASGRLRQGKLSTILKDLLETHPMDDKLRRNVLALLNEQPVEKPAKSCFDHEVTCHEITCKTGPVSGDLQVLE